MFCIRCKAACELCPAVYPWNEQHWICAECGSTFIYEWDRVKQEAGKLKFNSEDLKCQEQKVE